MTARLGQDYKTGYIPNTGQPNAGKWTVTFTPADIGVSLPVFECYHIVVTGGPPGSTFDVYVNNNLYDSVQPGNVNSWDPNNPMKLSNGDSVSFHWNVGTVGYQPTVWMYFQQESPL